MPEPQPLPVDPATSRTWTEIAIRVRLSDSMLRDAGDPLSASHIQQDDNAYPYEKLSAWVLSYLRASVDHLLVWANIVQPLQVFDGQVSFTITRPFFTLARAGLEAAAQASWVLSPRSSPERVNRHIRILYSDIENARKAYAQAGQKESEKAAADRIERIKERYIGNVSQAPNLVDMVKHSAKSMEWGSRPVTTPDALEFDWRAMSAAAHGKQWWMDSAHHIQIGEEYEPGYFRVLLTPDPTAITKVVGLAADLAFSATIRYVQGLGPLPALALQRARVCPGLS